MQKDFKGLIVLFFALCVLTIELPVWAVPHINPEAYPDAKPCHPKVLSSGYIKAAGGIAPAIISISTGTKTIAVILVQFQSANGTTSGSPSIVDINHFDTYFTNMANFYNEVSFGTMTLTFRFFGSGTGAANGAATALAAGSYTLGVAQTMQSYGCGDVDSGCSGYSTNGLGGAYLIRDAIAAARVGRAGFTSAAYDAVLVMHAGYGNETTSYNGDIWSAFYQEAAIIGAAGGGFVDGATFPELESSGITSPLGVMCHEFGHVLTLPDLYNTTTFGGTSVVGKWDLMDAGPYLGNGTNPAHIGAWGKTYLHWSTPQVVTSSASYTVHPISTRPPPSWYPNDMVKIPMQNTNAQEYFLLEYRSKTAGSYDQQIPGTGLLIWHIDDAITSTRGFDYGRNDVNSGSPHYGVSLVTADGINISNANQGDAGNAYSNGQSFFSPRSDTFSGQPSGVNVVNISGVGGATATFEVVSLAVTRTQSIAKLINFPNPAGKGYPHPNGEGHTTIQFHLGRPAVSFQVNIYTLSGELVRKVAPSEMILNIDRSVDNKWVYEYVWDLKNGDGQMVAPGVYMILARADGTTRTSKVVVIR